MHDTRRAETALRAAVLDERLLHGVQRTLFDNPSMVMIARLALPCQHEASVDGLTIEQHGTCAAIAVAATFLGSGQADAVAQQIEQRVAAVSQDLMLLPVDLQGQWSSWRDPEVQIAGAQAAARVLSAPTTSSRR